MKADILKGTLMHVDPWNIEPNPDNPRRLFDEADLAPLSQSIQIRGVLVPIIVFKNKGESNRYTLLDGERRLRCAQALALKTIPVNVIDTPARAENILLMFNIHNVRKDWELVPTALKLEVLIKLLKQKSGKEPSNSELSKLTGLSIIRIADSKRVLKYKAFHHLALDPDPSRRIGGDFFSQLELALEKLEEYPEIMSRFTKDKVIETIIAKKRDGTIKTFMEFRTLKKVLTSQSKGVPKNVIIKGVLKFLESKPVIDIDGRLKKPAMTIDDLYESTSKSAYLDIEIIKTCKRLKNLLNKFQDNAFSTIEIKDILSDLVKNIVQLTKRT
jgi:ParB family chromosome partitioning protein